MFVKNTLSLLFLIASISASAQYKHFTAGVFATTHNFESGNFYSTPEDNFQYNFNEKSTYTFSNYSFEIHKITN